MCAGVSERSSLPCVCRPPGKTVYEPANSCLRPLCSMGGLNVITAEGLGSRAKGYHPVQTALADANGSQCGFCSPGWTLQAYALLADDPTPSKTRVDNGFDGNLCRCGCGLPCVCARTRAFACVCACCPCACAPAHAQLCAACVNLREHARVCECCHCACLNPPLSFSGALAYSPF